MLRTDVYDLKIMLLILQFKHHLNKHKVYSTVLFLFKLKNSILTFNGQIAKFASVRSCVHSNSKNLFEYFFKKSVLITIQSLSKNFSYGYLDHLHKFSVKLYRNITRVIYNSINTAVMFHLYRSNG